MLICAAQLVVAGCAQMGAPPHAGQLTEQGRSMEAMLADVNQIRAFTYGSGDQRSAEAAATDLVAWSNRLAELFPPGQASQDYVDMSPERARNAPVAVQRAASQLLASVHDGNRALIGGRLQQLEQNGCGACHLSHP
jgi:hypothetical protein